MTPEQRMRFEYAKDRAPTTDSFLLLGAIVFGIAWVVIKWRIIA